MHRQEVTNLFKELKHCGNVYDIVGMYKAVEKLEEHNVKFGAEAGAYAVVQARKLQEREVINRRHEVYGATGELVYTEINKGNDINGTVNVVDLQG